MKKISFKEYDKLSLKQRSPIATAISKMAVGDMIMVQAEEFKFKSPFHQYIGSLFNKNNGALRKTNIKLKVDTLLDESGWVITRLK